jgi:hypothetical protein
MAREVCADCGREVDVCASRQGDQRDPNAGRDIESIRTDLADIRDRLETVYMEDNVAAQIVAGAVGALTTVLVALNHADVKGQQ